MAQLDWGTLDGGLAEDAVLRGPTIGTTGPNGGGPHVYGFKSVQEEAGTVGKHCLLTNFSPTPSGRGGRITGALKRGALGATNGFSPFFFFCAQGSSVNDSAYLLGLSDEATSHIELRKGPMSLGLPAPATFAPNVSPNILMRSADSFAIDTWQHLRLDVIVQGTGDVILQVFRNNLSLHSVLLPVWEKIPGMEGPYARFNGFVDDALGINTGSAAHSSGRMGFGARFDQPNRVVYFDHITVERQL